MTYHTSTELEVTVGIDRRGKKDDFQSIIHSAITDAFSEDFSELDFEFECEDGQGEVELEIYDSNSYRKSKQYEVCSNLIDALHEAGLQPMEISHSTELHEQEDDDEDEE